jgi:hypothetical protein
MKYFRAEEDPTARLPKNFISGFLEVGHWKIYVGQGSFGWPRWTLREGIDFMGSIMLCTYAIRIHWKNSFNALNWSLLRPFLSLLFIRLYLGLEVVYLLCDVVYRLLESETGRLAKVNQIFTALAKHIPHGCACVCCLLGIISTESIKAVEREMSLLLLTPGLDPEVHLCLGRMRDSVAAKLDVGTIWGREGERGQDDAGVRRTLIE